MGIDWTSPETLAANEQAANRIMELFFGVYLWEWVISLDFDWAFVSGQQKFRWPMIVYFLGRYSLLALFITMRIERDPHRPTECQALDTLMPTFGNTALAASALNLAIRTMAVWQNNRVVGACLSVLLVGQFTLMIGFIQAHIRGIHVEGYSCMIVSAERSDTVAAVYIVTMVVDFVILSLTVYKTYAEYRDMYHSGLIRLIFRDGLVYFAVVFLSNLFAVILSLSHLNPFMDMMAAYDRNMSSCPTSKILRERCAKNIDNLGLAPD
ncbi:hypothetical protein PM082_014883 [Marasmius tenuissimus]|nr:hypothetical protein PM082_014883 [Marasmius tenuissimus]